MRTQLLLGLVTIGALVSAGWPQIAAAREPQNRDRARDIAGWDLVRQRSLKSDFTGKWTLVHFWASW